MSKLIAMIYDVSLKHVLYAAVYWYRCWAGIKTKYSSNGGGGGSQLNASSSSSSSSPSSAAMSYFAAAAAGYGAANHYAAAAAFGAAGFSPSAAAVPAANNSYITSQQVDLPTCLPCVQSLRTSHTGSLSINAKTLSSRHPDDVLIIFIRRNVW